MAILKDVLRQEKSTHRRHLWLILFVMIGATKRSKSEVRKTLFKVLTDG